MSQLFPEYDKKYLEIMIQAHDHSSIRRFLTEKESDLIAIFNAGMKDEVTKKIIDKSGFFMGSFEQHEKKGKPLTFESMYGESVFQNFKAEDGSTNDELKREVKSEIEGIVEHILCTAIEDDESISFDLRGLSQEKFDDICENSDRLKTIYNNAKEAIKERTDIMKDEAYVTQRVLNQHKRSSNDISTSIMSFLYPAGVIKETTKEINQELVDKQKKSYVKKNM